MLSVHVSLTSAANVCRWGMLTSGTSASRGLFGSCGLATSDSMPLSTTVLCPVCGWGWCGTWGGGRVGLGFDTLLGPETSVSGLLLPRTGHVRDGPDSLGLTVCGEAGVGGGAARILRSA